MKLYDDLVYRGLIKDISSPDLEELLNKGGLTFYIGTDSTADSLHIGHYSSFLIAKRLKDKGHNPILLIGEATGLIGDPRPSGEREIIDKDLAHKNALAIQKQVEDLFGFQVVNNYDWSKEINFIDFLRDYGKHFPVNYMLEKDIVRRRLDTGITYTEFSYMIMQALDFHYLFNKYDCKMQIAGSDQWGNITAGIDLIRKKESKPAYGLTMPLILDQHGEKFGKSEGNALWIDKDKTSSYEVYQFLYNSSDVMVIDYLKKLTFLSKEEIEVLEKEHNNNPEKRLAHITLAKEVISFIHSEEDFNKAKDISEKLFSEKIYELKKNDIINSLKGVPTFEIDELNISINDLLVKHNVCSSKREVKEFIESGAIYINNKKIDDYNLIITKDMAIEKELLLIRRGKKKHFLGIIK